VDSEGVLERQMRRARADGFLVRPDRFIYCSDREFAPGDHTRVAAAVVSGLHLAQDWP